MKDSTEFKQRFKRWQEGEKVYEAGKILPEVVVTADDPIKKLVEDVNSRSNADFVNRVKDPNRTWIQDWEHDGYVATHKLSWAEDDGKAIVFPNVQNINGELHDFTDPKYNHGKWDALDSAIERGDTLLMTPKQAKMYTENYKKYYPKGKTFDCGKSLPKYDGGTDEEDPPSVKLSREIMSILRGGDFASSRIESGEPSESDALATYLLSRKQLRELFLKHGYIESPKDYGLVKKAVGKRDLPVYQRSEDQIDRLSVIPIGNVDTLWGGDKDDMLVHAGNYPTTIYLDPKTLDLYQKAWDLNDYGPSSGGTATHYGFPKQVAANLLDLIGSPVVVTTGIRKIKYPKQDEFLNLKDNYMKSKGYHIIEDYEDVPLYDMSGKNVIGKFSEKTKRYVLPEITVTAPKKHNSGKSIKPIPKYDGGTDDKTYLPEYEYEATVTPQDVSLEKHKRITNEEDWLKYWGNVGAGYVNKALESVAKPILEGLKNASYFTPLGNATAFGDLLAANINGDKDEVLANAAGLLPQVRWAKGINKTALFFNAVPEKSSFKLLRDVLTSPDEVIAARRAGRYPLTFSERRDYVKLLQNEATDAWYNVQDMQDALSSEYPKLFLPGYRIKRPKTIIGGDNIVKRAGLSDNALGHYDPSTGDVVLRRRKPGSLLPAGHKYGFKGLSAHEYLHAVRDYDSYFLEDPFTFSTEVDYDKLNPNFVLSPLFKDVIAPMGASGKNRTAWQMSPNEFLSDYWKYRAASDPFGNLVPPFHKMNDLQKSEVVDFLSGRFDLSQQTVRNALLDISFIGGYDKGKSIKPAKRK